jgi:hypothetical protein
VLRQPHGCPGTARGNFCRQHTQPFASADRASDVHLALLAADRVMKSRVRPRMVAAALADWVISCNLGTFSMLLVTPRTGASSCRHVVALPDAEH